MKSLARMYVWWPGLDKDIESSVQACAECQAQQSAPPVAPLQPWKWPSRPWVRLHMDYAGPFQGKMFLVVIDAHSKWVEAFPTNSSTSAVVIDHISTLFAQFGYPEVVVTDNGSCFVSEEFEAYLLKNGIRHLTSAPYHPATNGLAERAVQILKKGLKKEKQGSVSARLARVLFGYRITPQSTTGVSPAQLLLNRQPRTKFDLLRPNLTERVEQHQSQHKSNHDGSSRERRFSKGETVYAQNFGQGQRWIPGVIQEVTGPVSFLVRLDGNRIVRKHLDHLRRRVSSGGTTTVAPHPEVELEAPPMPIAAHPTASVQPNLDSSGDQSEPPSGVAGEDASPVREPENPSAIAVPPDIAPEATPDAVSMGTSLTPPRKSYPTRDRKPPDWYHNLNHVVV